MSRRATAARGARTIALAAVSATGALLLAACSPTTTALNYDPSDGTGVSVLGEDDRDLRGINLMVVSAGEGEPGNLLGALANETAQDASFTLEAPGSAPVTLDVPAGGTVYLGTETGETVTLDAVGAAPGDYLDAVLSVGADSAEFPLPVLDGTLPEYADQLPAAQPSPSASPTQ
ncbi:hypothetical protein ACFQHV_06090 [Promicromonospora thailandica]|uniref:Copper(I)-binding protein n=1 Tax=Promicromonospora thailandica TaxID=765201 RepID=A0A9X2JWC9_9MICO|nr:hypothetical protein [Promicromonospora thailandica]MCP2266490.1 hypothetical protein [Promicromonospora thailandica]